MIYYQDDYATIHYAPCAEIKAETIILDPPYFLKDIAIFKAKTLFIFAGNLVGKYADLFPEREMGTIHWKWLCNGDEWGRAFIHEDIILMVGTREDLYSGIYILPPLKERLTVWQRPVGLMIDILKYSTGDVLDPFMGSGSALVAAKILKRKSVGYDIDEKCCQIAADRLRRIK